MRKIHIIRSVCMLLVILLKFSRSVFPKRDNGCGSLSQPPPPISLFLSPSLSPPLSSTYIRFLMKLDLATFWPRSYLWCFFLVHRRHCLVFVTINYFFCPTQFRCCCACVYACISLFLALSSATFITAAAKAPILAGNNRQKDMVHKRQKRSSKSFPCDRKQSNS